MKMFTKQNLTISVSDLRIEATDTFTGRRRLWKLTDDFRIEVRARGLNYSIVVPRGFETDFATLPLVAQIALGNRDTYVYAATAHDFLCVIKAPRWLANPTMIGILSAMGCPWWKRQLFAWGLFLFGYGSRPSRLFYATAEKVKKWFNLQT